MTAPVEGCCHSAKNPRIGERVGVGGLFRVLDCCAGGLARLVGVSSVPKRQRKIAERTDVDVLGKLEGKPAMLGRLIPTPSRARGAATQPGSPGAFNRGRATGERVDGWTVTAPEAPTTIPSRLPTRGVVCAAWRPGHPGGGRPSVRTSLHPLREAARDPHACRDQASARRCRPRGVGVDCRRAGRLRSGRMAPGSPRYGPAP